MRRSTSDDEAPRVVSHPTSEAPAAAADGGDRQPTVTPLRTLFARLITVCILPLLLLAGWLAWMRIADVDRLRDEAAADLARNFASAVDQQVAARIHGLELLASSPLLDDRARWPDHYREAQGFLRSFGSHVLLADLGEPMAMLFNTRLPFGSPLPPVPRPSGRSSVRLAAETGKPAVGDLFFGPVAKEPLVSIAVPVLRDRRIAYLLVTTVETRQLQERLDRLALPAGWGIVLRDSLGETLARRAPAAYDSSRDADGGDRIIVPLTESPWSVALEIPRSAHWRPLVDTATAVGFGLLAATVAAALGGIALSRRVGRAVASLTEPAATLDSAASITEVVAARRLLTQSAAQREASEALFRRLFDEAPTPMAHLDPTGRIVARNAAFLSVIGYTPDEVATIDDWWVRAYPDPSYRAEVLASWDKASTQATASGGSIAPGEYRVTCRDGRERVFRITGIPVSGGILTSFADLTEQRAAESELRLWASAFQHAGLGVAIADGTTGRITAVNPTFARERGYSPEDLIGQPIFTVFPPDRHDELRRRIGEVHGTGHGTFEAEHLARDGRRFPVLVDLTAVRDPSGRTIVRIGYVLDLTERKRVERELHEAQAAVLAEQRRAHAAVLDEMRVADAARARAETALAARRESEERLAIFIEHAPAALAMFDREMRYLAASRRWRIDYSLGETPLTGRSHYDVFPEISDGLREIHRRGLAGEVSRGDADRFERADGTIQWIRWEVRPWQAADGTVGGIVIFSEDITVQRKAEEEIRRLNTDLEHRVERRTAELTAANEELDTFAYAVSHDLRAPLRAMSGFAQALEEDLGPAVGANARGHLERIRVASRHMGELIDGLLALSRSTRSVSRQALVDLSAIAERRLAELRRAEPGRSVRCDIEPGLLAIGDERMLEVVVANLLDNAWKYTGRTPEATIRFASAALDGQPAFSISDNGAGFDMADATRLFEPFQRLHRRDEFPGLGIGLATVRRIVQRHRGTIVAEGVPGHGATFRFTLPRPHSAAED